MIKLKNFAGISGGTATYDFVQVPNQPVADCLTRYL
uniref:Uncharacterized protein n=1 Tax=Rhizophora mucronata TaxID=61149 RepID=A0A2P2PLL9_RHIMU